MASQPGEPRNPALDLLERFETEDIEFFQQFDTIADDAVVRASRDMPADFYDELRTGILASLMSVIGGGRLTVTLVIDTNIIVGDAFRVAKGKPSTTERLMSSRFVGSVSPRDITREAREQVVKDLPKGASLEAAKMQAERLLSQIHVISGPSRSARSCVPGRNSRIGT